MIRYFQKELPDSPLLINGYPMRFDFLPTEDPNLIAELDNCVKRSIGGVTEITKAQFDEEVKKKELEKVSGNSLKQPPHRTELFSPNLGPGAVVGSRFARPQMSEWHRGPGDQSQPQPVAHPMPDPIEVPTAASFALPPTAKMKDLKEMAERTKPK